MISIYNWQYIFSYSICGHILPKPTFFPAASNKVTDLFDIARMKNAMFLGSQFLDRAAKSKAYRSRVDMHFTNEAQIDFPCSGYLIFAYMHTLKKTAIIQLCSTACFCTHVRQFIKKFSEDCKNTPFMYR